MIITIFMAYFVTTNRRIVATDCSQILWSYRRCRALAATTTAHIHCICPPSKFLCSFCHVAHLREHGHRNKGALNSWSQFLCFGGCGVCFWCDTPLLRTGIFALDLCGNSIGGAKPRSTALGGMGSMPIMSWLRLYEFMVLPHRKTNIH